MKRIYLEPIWKMHSFYEELMRYPPQGYEFVTRQTSTEMIAKAISKINFLSSLQYPLYKIAPLNLIKSYLERFKSLPEGIDLTYSVGRLIFRKEPWIIDLEYVSIPVGHGKHLNRYKNLIEKAFASGYCKKILCWYEAARKTVLSNLDCTEFEHKMEVIPFSARKRDFIKYFNDDKVKLLFVGSANLPGEFEIKGGAEVVETFLHLNRKYDNLELVIRSDMPRNMKDKCKQFSNIKVIDGIIPWEQLEQEFKTADIFLLPAHNTPWMVFLDAMSYELPVVTIDAWANSEIIDNGKTGLLAQKSDKLQYYTESFLPNWDTSQFRRAIKTADPEVVDGLVEKTSILIENKELRRKMGKAGRWEIEQGKFSVKRRNEKLKRIFDEATA